MSISLKSTANFVENGAKFLVSGGPGVGKTPLIATLAPWSPVIGSAEAGLMSLRQYNLPYVEIDSISKLREFHKWFVESREAKQFGAVCLDSISEIAEISIESQKRTNKDGRKAYGEMNDEIIALVKAFRDIVGRHVYISAKETYAQSPEGGMQWFPMMPTNKLGPSLAYYFDYAFRMKRVIDPVTKNDIRWLQCKPTFDAFARDRSGVLQETEPADLSAIIQKLRG